MKNVRLLDCTLRDGGHVNNGEFGESVIKYTIQKLVSAKTDIIEVGFLWQENCGKDIARFLTIEDVKRILPANLGNSKISLMADFINLEKLEPYDGTVEYIRLSFKRQRLDWALKTLKILQDKGYKCVMNPVNYNVYSDKEYLSIIEKINEAKPYGFSIVDTFGVMRLSDLSGIYYLVEKNLSKDIIIGLHLHENLGLAYSLAQHFLSIRNPLREIIMDASLLGMGRVPGNLCTEQIMDHLNFYYGSEYNLAPVYDAIDDYIAPIKANKPWGYSIPYALSAQRQIHRTYAEYLMGKWKLKTSDIQNILSKIDASETELFNRDYVEELYQAYLNVDIADKEDIIRLKEILQEKNIQILAPGASLLKVTNKIIEQKDSRITISVNFVPNFIKSDIIFFTNIKRYETESVNLCGDETIVITSNLIKNVDKYSYAIKYGRLAYHKGRYCEDSVLMLLHLLSDMGIQNIDIAGFDGFIDEGNNFYEKRLDRYQKGEFKNELVREVLSENYSNMKLNYLSKSHYTEEKID